MARKFNWWELLGTIGGGVGGAAVGTALGHPVAGATFGAGLGQQISPGGFWEEEPPALPTRPALGAEGQRAALEQAKYFKSVLGQQMASNIDIINRQFATAGRTSGQRGRYIGEEMEHKGQQLGQMVSGTAMDRWQSLLNAQLAREQMDVSEEQFQAQLESGGAAGRQQMYGQIGQMMFLYFLQNPEAWESLKGLFGGRRQPAGSPGLASSWEEERLRLGGR